MKCNHKMGPNRSINNDMSYGLCGPRLIAVGCRFCDFNCKTHQSQRHANAQNSIKTENTKNDFTIVSANGVTESGRFNSHKHQIRFIHLFSCRRRFFFPVHQFHIHFEAHKKSGQLHRNRYCVVWPDANYYVPTDDCVRTASARARITFHERQKKFLSFYRIGLSRDFTSPTLQI